jgi:hypothetical protein
VRRQEFSNNPRGRSNEGAKECQLMIDQEEVNARIQAASLRCWLGTVPPGMLGSAAGDSNPGTIRERCSFIGLAQRELSGSALRYQHGDGTRAEIPNDPGCRDFLS